MRIDEIGYTLYVDLDGVLADLNAFMSKAMGRDLTHFQDKWGKDVWKKFNQMQDDGVPTFEALDKMPDADVLWEYVKPYHPNILTATGHRYEIGLKEKTEWVKKNLTGYNQIHVVPTSKDKAQFATPHSILIDDREKSILPWREAGGIGLLHTSAQDTIKQLEILGL